MLEEGAGSRSALEIADAVDFLGADLGADEQLRLVGGPAARAGRAARRRAADHGRRRAAADVPEGRARAAAPAAAHRHPPGARRSGRRFRRVAFSRVLYGPAHRYGTPTIGTAETIKAFTRRRSPRVLRVDVPAGERRRSSSVGDVTPDKVAAAPRDELRRAGRPPAGAGAGASCPPVEQPATRADLSRRQAGRAAVADPHRLDRRAAIDARLLPAQVMNTILGGSFTLAPEHEPARGARLHLRRELVVRHARRSRARSSRPPACRPTRPPRR